MARFFNPIIYYLEQDVQLTWRQLHVFLPQDPNLGFLFVLLGYLCGRECEQSLPMCRKLFVLAADHIQLSW